MLKAYIEGVAALRTRKELAYKVLGKYMLGASDSLDEAYEYAVKYLDRNARIDPAVIQTVLNWENKGEAGQRMNFSTIRLSIGLSKRDSSSGLYK